MAPTVQTLDQILAGYQPAYAGQKNVYNQMMTQNKANAEQKKQGLFAQQKEAFSGIEQTAANKGMLFSGFSPDQQARYTSTKFLPAMAGLEQETMAGNNRLALALAGLDTEARNKAESELSRQKQNLFTWQQAESARQAQAEQERLRREQQERQFQANYALQQQQMRSQASAAGGGRASNQESFAGALASAAGGDGKVSPGDYNALKNQWVSAGYGDYKSFHDKFWKFANNSHWWDYYYN